MAWSIKEEEINNFFTSAWSTHGVHVAHVTAPHGTGKSTSLIEHIVGLKTSLEVDTELIYVPKSSTKGLLTQTYAKAADFTVLTVDRASLIRKMPSPGVVMTWIIDLETMPSGDGEIAMGNILATSKRQHHDEANTVIVTLGTFRDTSMEECLARFLGVEATTITIAETEPPITLLPLEVERLQDVLARDTLMTPEEMDTAQEKVGLSLVMAGDDVLDAMLTHLEELGRPVKYIGIDLDISHLQHTLQHFPLVALDGVNIPIVTHRLRRCITDCAKTTAYLDLDISQRMTGARRLTRLEFLDQLGWIWKTGARRSDVEVYAPIWMIDIMRSTESQTDGRQVSGWDGDPMVYLLRLFSTWSGWTIREMPVRSFPRQMKPLMCEYIMRLQYLGCLSEESVSPTYGSFETTGRGERIVELRRLFGEDMDFHTAYFLAAVESEAFIKHPNAQRVMIRLAALLMQGVHTLIAFKVDLDQVNRDTIKGLCAGVGADRSHWGAAWLALGIWQRLLIERQFYGEDLDLHDEPLLTFPRYAGAQVLQTVKSFEAYFEVAGAPNELEATKLTAEELEMIDKEMARAWFYRVVYVRCENLQVVEVVSNAVITTDTPKANLALAETANIYRHAGMKGYFGFYTDLEETGPFQYQCRNITVLDGGLFA
jgi:hypothetical protein